MANLEKLLSLLQQNGFLHQVVKNGGSSCTFGPGLTLLRQNILNMWLDRMVTRAEGSYPVEGHSSIEPLDYYPEIFGMINNQVPFSIAHTACRPMKTVTSEHLKPFYNFGQEKSLTFLHFCQQTLVRSTFDQVVNDRQTWWKQFSFNSSDILLEDMQQMDGVQTGRCIKYNFPWGAETIETVCLMGDEHLKFLEEQTETICTYRHKKKNMWPGHIRSETTLEICTAVYLKDAFVEKDDRQVLHMHTSLAPYKGAICRDGTHHQEINELATYISAALRKEGIKIVDTRESHVSLEDQFQRYDEMGVPFSIVVSDSMIETGTVKVRNRDTGIQDYSQNQQHIKHQLTIFIKEIILAARDVLFKYDSYHDDTILVPKETMAMGKLPMYFNKHIMFQPES